MQSAMQNITLSPADLTDCQLRVQSTLITERSGIPDPHVILFWCSMSTTFQALIAGSCLQLVYHYWYQPRRDSTLGRIAIGSAAVASLCQVAIANYSMAQLIKFDHRYIGYVFLDWWLYQLSYLLFILTCTPILVFFTHRAYIIWDRSRLILFICLSFILPAGVLGLVNASLALRAPWGIKPLTNEQFLQWTPTFVEQYTKSHIVYIVTILAQLIAVVVVCVTTCYGIFRHRNGIVQVDSAIAKVVFLCGESLLPVVGIALLDTISALSFENSVATILSRICVQLEPLLYFHGLMSALVSRERVATILSAEPVRQMTAYAASPSSPRDMSPSTPDIDVDIDLGPIPLSCVGAKINWTTLQVEPEDEYASPPDFVDVMKISYHSQLRNDSYDVAGSPTAGREGRDRRRLASGETIVEINAVGNGVRNEAGRSVYSFEEMLHRAPQWPPAGRNGRGRDGPGPGPRAGKRAHSFAGPSDQFYDMP